MKIPTLKQFPLKPLNPVQQVLRGPHGYGPGPNTFNGVLTPKTEIPAKLNFQA